MLTTLYELVMDPDRNPLRALPKMVRFQFMVVLAYMWSVVFSIYVGMIALVGPSIVVHTILLIGVFFTADVFRRARKRALGYEQLRAKPTEGIARNEAAWAVPAQELRSGVRA